MTEAPVLPVSPAESQLKVWMSKYGWSADESGQIFICSQEESIKPKNIVEKIDFDSEWWPEALGCGSKGEPFHRDRGWGSPGPGMICSGSGLGNLHLPDSADLFCHRAATQGGMIGWCVVSSPGTSRPCVTPHCTQDFPGPGGAL